MEKDQHTTVKLVLKTKPLQTLVLPGCGWLVGPSAFSLRVYFFNPKTQRGSLTAIADNQLAVCAPDQLLSDYAAAAKFTQCEYIRQSDKLIFLAEGGDLHQYDFISNSCLPISESYQEGSRVMQRPLRPTKEGEQYSRICQSAEGQLLFLQTRSCIEVLDASLYYKISSPKHTHFVAY